MKRTRPASSVTADTVHRPLDSAGDDRDLRLLDAFYHELAMDEADAPSWNRETEQLEQSEQDALLAKLLALPARPS